VIQGGTSMLILTITKDDPITIGDATIPLKGEGQVRLAIDAPKEVSVLRRRAEEWAIWWGRAPAMVVQSMLVAAMMYLIHLILTKKMA
jgi:hypothetical protein